MKKGIRILFALIALLGVMNCIVLGPALAAFEEEICVAPDGSDDCFVCCSFNHPMISARLVSASLLQIVSGFIESGSVTHFDSPSFSIFRPPLAV